MPSMGTRMGIQYWDAQWPAWVSSTRIPGAGTQYRDAWYQVRIFCTGLPVPNVGAPFRHVHCLVAVPGAQRPRNGAAALNGDAQLNGSTWHQDAWWGWLVLRCLRPVVGQLVLSEGPTTRCGGARGGAGCFVPAGGGGVRWQPARCWETHAHWWDTRRSAGLPTTRMFGVL